MFSLVSFKRFLLKILKIVNYKLGLSASVLFLVSGLFFAFSLEVNAQASTGTAVDRSVVDALNISIEPNPPVVGQRAIIKVSIKDDKIPTEQKPTVEAQTFDMSVDILPDGATSCGVVFGRCISLVDRAKGQKYNSATTTIVLDSNNFTVGKNVSLLVTLFQNTAIPGTGNYFYQYYGNVSVSPQVGTNTGSGIEISDTGTVNIDPSNPTKNFKVVYTGTPSKQINSIKYQCDSSVGVQTVSGDSFQCTYTHLQGATESHQVAVTATLSDGTTITQNSSVKVGDGDVASNRETIDSAGGDNTIFGFIAKIIGFLMGLVNEILFNVFWYLIAPVLQAMLAIRTYTDAFANVIYPGWEVIRNLANIFFIISLIFIALATLFRLESYNYKHLLVNVIIAALLVNFSLVIGQAILGVADTIQNQFLPNNVEVIRVLGQKLMVQGYRDLIFDPTLRELGDYGATATIVQMFFLMALAIGGFIVFGAIAAFLVLRIVMLWILLMLSPVPYFANVLPFTKQYVSMWWGYFLKYAFFTPIMAFFLNMAAIIVDNNPRVVESLINGNLYAQGSQYQSLTTFAVKISSNILLLVFLIVSVKVAEQFGIAGAGALTKAVQGGMLLPVVGTGAAAGFGARRLGGYVARRWNEYTGETLKGHDAAMSPSRRLALILANPVAAWKSYSKRQEELAHEAQGMAEAASLMAVEQTLTGGKKVIDRTGIFEKHAEDEFLKTMQGKSKEELYKMADNIVGMKDNMEGRAAKRAIVKAILSEGYLDDLIQDGTKLDNSQLLKRMQSLDGPYKIGDVNDDEDFYDVVGEDGSVTRKMKYNQKTMRAAMLAMFDPTDQAAWRMLNDDGDYYGRKTKHYEYLTLANFDPDSGKHYMYGLDSVTGKADSTDWKTSKGISEGERYAVGEINKIENSRLRAGLSPHTGMMFDAAGSLYKEVFRTLAGSFYENAAFMQGRTPDYYLASGKSTEQYIDKATKALKNLTEADLKRIDAMAAISPEATAALYLKAINGNSTSGGITTWLKENKNGIPYQVKERIREADGTEKEVTVIKYRALGKPKEEKSKITQVVDSDTSPVKAEKRVEVVDQIEKIKTTDLIPEFNSLVSAIQGVQGAVEKRDDAVKLANSIIKSNAERESKGFDFSKFIDLNPSGRDVHRILSTQEYEKMSEVLKMAVQRGMENAAKHSDSGKRIDELTLAIQEELKKHKKDLANRDWETQFDSAEMAKAVYKELQNKQNKIVPNTTPPAPNP